MDTLNLESLPVSDDSRNFLFFKQIYKKVGSGFVPASVKKKSSESQGNFKESMKRYFENFILMDAVTKSINSTAGMKEINISESYKTTNESPDAGSHPFYLNAIKICAGRSEISSQLKLLGADQEYISKVLEKVKNQREMLKLTSLVENYINEFCAKVISYSAWSDVPVNNRNTLENALKELSSKARLSDTAKSCLQPKQAEVQDMLLLYYKELNEGLSMLYELITLQEKKLRFELDLSKLFSLKCSTLYLKTRLFEVSILKDTYTKETVPALGKISMKLDEKEERLLKEQKDKQTCLQAYEILGPKYKELAEQYLRLSEEIEKQKWAIETLRERQQR